MRSLPRRFRPPKGIYGVLGSFSWLVLVVVVFSVVYASWTTPVKWGMMLLTVAFLGALFGWVSMVGTIVEPEGVTRRALFAVQHYRWMDIIDVDVRVNPVVAMVGPFQAAPRVMVLVRARQHDRKKKTLHFFDDRAYLSVRDFERELNEFLVLWQQRRHESPR